MFDIDVRGRRDLYSARIGPACRRVGDGNRGVDAGHVRVGAVRAADGRGHCLHLWRSADRDGVGAAAGAESPCSSSSKPNQTGLTRARKCY